ncbi:MAG: ribonuclease HII [Candidatus Kapaibacterium sp.]|nr:MAG: ribonuclease HII [Candidatus Kapabacteria bacterium]
MKDQKILIGVDEVGRGCLAGPLYAAAVILPEGFDTSGLRDSKKLSPRQRERLAERINAEAVVGMGIASVETIAKINVLQATMEAMHAALYQVFERIGDLSHRKQHEIIVDGNYFHSTEFVFDVQTIVRGDAIYPCISAASIVAKVARDAYMRDVAHVDFPLYNFARHKGYGTKEHREAIINYGACPLHRKLFLRNIVRQMQELQ